MAIDRISGSVLDDENQLEGLLRRRGAQHLLGDWHHLAAEAAGTDDAVEPHRSARRSVAGTGPKSIQGPAVARKAGMSLCSIVGSGLQARAAAW